MRKKRRSLAFPREVLLVEIERHCADASCNARTRVGLTKEEARLYDGFECERCERWHADGLTERDIPDWWEELTVTGLATLRGKLSGEDAAQTNEAGETGSGGVVARLSEAWQHQARREGRGAAVDAPGDGGDESL
ncbi:MAG TPA: hypothetical protein VF527_15900 [Pyrinomonadaceae bacterium]